jgi:hypothetical protein
MLPAQWKQRKLHDVFHASLLTPYHETEAHGANYLEPPPDVIGGEDEYEVEQVLDSKRMGRKQKLHYLIRWKGYLEAHNTWEPEENVRHAKDLVALFHEKYPLTTRKCYLNNKGQGDEIPSPTSHTSMSNNGSQDSSQSDPSITIDWSPYPATEDDHHTAGVTSTLSNLTIANPGAVQVVGAAPIYVRTTTTTNTQPETTVCPSFLRATTCNRPYWYDLDPEVYYSDGERRRINPSPTETSLYTDS